MTYHLPSEWSDEVDRGVEKATCGDVKEKVDAGVKARDLLTASVWFGAWRVIAFAALIFFTIVALAARYPQPSPVHVVILAVAVGLVVGWRQRSGPSRISFDGRNLPNSLVALAILLMASSACGNPAEGTCPANLIGGPLVSNSQAAAMVVATPRSIVETGPNGPANAAANNYFSTVDQADYMAQLAAFHATADPWGGVTARIDGACPLWHPTTAQVLQWAAHKWGINPALLYAEATIEGDWDMTSIGDAGGSSGVLQVADRPANRPGGEDHAFPGFAGAGSMLARESTCFNADYYAGHLYAVYHGLMVGQKTPPGDINAAIQEWFIGWTATAPGPYSQKVCTVLARHEWTTKFFRGQNVPY
ncbi:MAG: hypothetical protein JO166_11890 [Deltaproteobacteria bacterium]|nr:hypothetical protein [Deltaproteobacteria bacterium]